MVGALYAGGSRSTPGAGGSWALQVRRHHAAFLSLSVHLCSVGMSWRHWAGCMPSPCPEPQFPCKVSVEPLC